MRTEPLPQIGCDDRFCDFDRYIRSTVRKHTPSKFVGNMKYKHLKKYKCVDFHKK